MACRAGTGGLLVLPVACWWPAGGTGGTGGTGGGLLVACRAISLPVCQSAGGGFVLVCAYICWWLLTLVLANIRWFFRSATWQIALKMLCMGGGQKIL